MTEEPQAEPEADTPWSTGDERVDEAVARLDDLDERDVDEHADVYDTIHGRPRRRARRRGVRRVLTSTAVDDPAAAAGRRAGTPLAGPQP